MKNEEDADIWLFPLIFAYQTPNIYYILCQRSFYDCIIMHLICILNLLFIFLHILENWDL